MEQKDMAEMYRRNAELGDTICNATTEVGISGGKKPELRFIFPEEIRKKAEQLVSQSLDKLLAL